MHLFTSAIPKKADSILASVVNCPSFSCC